VLLPPTYRLPVNHVRVLWIIAMNSNLRVDDLPGLSAASGARKGRVMLSERAQGILPVLASTACVGVGRHLLLVFARSVFDSSDDGCRCKEAFVFLEGAL
jgi:hypothetical protein